MHRQGGSSFPRSKNSTRRRPSASTHVDPVYKGSTPVFQNSTYLGLSSYPEKMKIPLPFSFMPSLPGESQCVCGASGRSLESGLGGRLGARRLLLSFIFIPPPPLHPRLVVHTELFCCNYTLPTSPLSRTRTH